MTSHIPGDVIVIDDSSDAAEPKPTRKRSRSKSVKDARSTSSSASSATSKKARRSIAKSNVSASVSQGSEEGEIDDSDHQSRGSQVVKVENQESETRDQPRQPAHGLSAAATSAEATPSVAMLPDPPLWTQGPISFKLPTFAPQREGSWLARFNDWANLFFHNNLDRGVALTASLIVAGYDYYLDNFSGIKSGKRKSGKKAARAAEKSGALAKTLKKLRAKAPRHHTVKPASNGPERQSGRVSKPQSGQALNDSAPMSGETNGGQGRSNGDERSPNGTKDEDDGLTEEEKDCFLCGSTDPAHVPEDCRDHWAQVYPPDDMLNKVVDLPITCAICASREHFLSECPERVYPANPTWSLANRSRFIDPDCGVLCKEDAMRQREGLAQAPATHAPMRPRAARAPKVHYSESDDSDIEFLGNRIVEQSKVGQIRISTNIMGGAANHVGQPAGAPPPGPAHAATRGQQRPNPQPRVPGASLPAKPPPPSQGFQGAAPSRASTSALGQEGSHAGHGRGGQGRRGGNRGRGRARGRGRGN